jgi:hypothetical protein
MNAKEDGKRERESHWRTKRGSFGRKKIKKEWVMVTC